MRFRNLALGIALIATMIAIAALRIPAQTTAGSSAAAPTGAFELHPLPGTSGQWLVLDTRTGDVQHWARTGQSYIVIALKRNMIAGEGWKQEVIRPPNDSSR